MQIDADKTTLVLAGAFNPAILTPQWIGKHALDPPVGENFPVQMLAPIISGGAFQMPRFSFGDLSYSPTYQSVTFYVEDEARAQRVCDVAARILGLLPHTPILGLGINFGFTDSQPSVELLNLLQTRTAIAQALSAEAEVVGRKWTHIVTWGKAVVTMQCSIDNTNVVTTDLNFHYAAQSAADAAAVLQKPNVFADHLAAAKRVSHELAHEDME
jgi:hypothetical protein